jgi:hypothetical protein
MDRLARRNATACWQEGQEKTCAVTIKLFLTFILFILPILLK